MAPPCHVPYGHPEDRVQMAGRLQLGATSSVIARPAWHGTGRGREKGEAMQAGY